MKIMYTRKSPHAVLLQRYGEDGRANDYVICANEDVAIVAIQSAGKPTLIKTGIVLNCGENQAITLSVCLLPSIADNTGLLLTNPILTVSNGEEIVLRIINNARNVQTITAGSMLATIQTIDNTAEFVEASAQTHRINKRRTRKD